MDLMADNSPASLTPAQSYTEAQWDAKRPLITKRYRDDARPLHQVRLVLSQPNFGPTCVSLPKLSSSLKSQTDISLVKQC